MACPSISRGGWEGPMLGQAPAPAYPNSAPTSQQYYGAPPGGYLEGELSHMATAPCLPAAAPDGAAAYATASPIGYPASSQQTTHQGMAKGSFVAPAYGICSAAHGSPMQHHQQGGMAPMPAGPTLGAATAAAASVVPLQVARPIHAPLVSSQYCYSQPVTLILVERASYGGIGGDDFDIFDTTGRPRFKLSAKVFSHSCKRSLIDLQTGAPIVSMERIPFSLAGRWAISDGQRQRRIAEAKPVMVTFKPRIKVYLNDGDKEADFEARGNFRGRSFEVVYKGGPSGGSERLVATVVKESSYANTESYIRNKFLNKQTYFLTVQPGVDVAFMAALGTLIDEIVHDGNE